jgi:DNA repair photolyase
MALISKPKRAAGEYSKYSISFYEGCTEKKCGYCYMQYMSKRFGSYFGVARLKPKLIDEYNAFEVFKKEVNRLLPELQKHGLFFNFSSDPFLPQSIDMNVKAFYYCEQFDISVKALTKQTWWIDRYLEYGFNTIGIPRNVAVGFTLTGHDELELGASTNQERIEAMKKLHNAGLKTFASIEPVIDFESSMDVIVDSLTFCDLYKIGLEAGKSYNIHDLIWFMDDVVRLCKHYKIYFKDSLLKQAGILRNNLPENCVSRNYNIFTGKDSFE